MSGNTCFKCGRALSDPDSVEKGIGPICAARRDEDLTAEEVNRRENLRCYRGFCCACPEHAGTLMMRFLNRFQAMAVQTGLLLETTVQVIQATAEFADCLGLLRERAPVPEIEAPMFGRETICELGISPEQRNGLTSYAMPPDHDAQYRHKKLRALNICPFGLDCRDPMRARSLVWRLLSIMRYEVEPQIARTGWGWDRLMYQNLANIFEVMGEPEEARDIAGVVDEQHRKKESKRRQQSFAF